MLRTALLQPAQSVRLLLVVLGRLVEHVPAAEGSKLGDSLCKSSVKFTVGHDVVVLTPDHLRCLAVASVEGEGGGHHAGRDGLLLVLHDRGERVDGVCRVRREQRADCGAALSTWPSRIRGLLTEHGPQLLRQHGCLI